MSKFIRWFFGAKNTVEPEIKPEPKFFRNTPEKHFGHYNRLITRPSNYVSGVVVESGYVFDCPRCGYVMPSMPGHTTVVRVCPSCKLGIQRTEYSSSTVYLGEVSDEWLEAYPIEQD